MVRLEAGAVREEPIRQRARVDKFRATRVRAAKVVDSLPIAWMDLTRERPDPVVELLRERLRQRGGRRVTGEVAERDEAVAE